MVNLIVLRNWPIKHLDVDETTFLNGDLDDEVFMELPKGWHHDGSSYKIYKLLHAIYGLKQVECAWYIQIDSFLQK
jgi:hypothetical protein